MNSEPKPIGRFAAAADGRQQDKEIKVTSIRLCDLLISQGYRPTRSKPTEHDRKKFIYYFEPNAEAQQIVDEYKAAARDQ